MKQTLLITTILSGLLSVSNSYAQTCTAAPDCASLGYTITDATVCTSKNLKFLACPFDETKGVCTTAENDCASLGYTDTTDLCPGDYSICPHDTTKVKCQLDAAVGDLKFSWQSKNHDGWLLCDGSTFSKEQFPKLYNLFRKTTLPDYRGYFLKGAKAGADFSVMEPETLPNIKGQFAFHPRIARDGRSNPFTYDHSGALLKAAAGDTGSKRAEGGASYSSGFNYAADKIVLDASAYQVYTEENKVCKTGTDGTEVCRYSPYIDGAKVAPDHYSAHIFIYAGKKEMTGTQMADDCKVGYVFYGNGVCSSGIESGKTPWGVISSISKSADKITYKYIYSGGDGAIPHTVYLQACRATDLGENGGELLTSTRLEYLYQTLQHQINSDVKTQLFNDFPVNAPLWYNGSGQLTCTTFSCKAASPVRNAAYAYCEASTSLVMY